MKVALYCRVSTSQQVEDGYSLQAQEDKLKKLASDSIIYKIYRDEGISGKDTEHRPGFQEMLKDMRDGKFKRIIVMKLDRLSRSILDLELLIQELKKYNCDLVSANEDIDTSSSLGMVFVRLLGIFAQFERERITERINDVFDYKTSVSKEVVSGTKIYGYDIVDKHYVINDDEAKNINLLYDKYLELGSVHSTWKWWYENIKQETLPIMRNRLVNKKYIGIYERKGKVIEGFIPSIINIDKYNKVQKMLSMNHKVYTSKSDRNYLFASLCRCGICGKKMRGTATSSPRSKSYRKYYTCCSGIRCTNRKYYNEKTLEKEVLKMLPIEMELMIQKANKKESEIPKDNTAKIKGQIARLQELYINDMIDIESYKSRYNTLEIELNENIKARQKVKVPKQIKELVGNKNFYDLYNKLDDKNKSIFYKNIIQEIILDDDLKINLVIA